MGTYEKPGIIQDTRFQAARGASQQVSKTLVEGLEKKKKAEEMLKLKRQKLNESMYGLQLDVSKVKGTSDKSLTASLRNTLNGELQHIYQLGLDSLKTGDNSEYLAAKAKFQGWVQKLPEQLGNLDYEAKMWSEKGDQALTWGNNSMYGEMFDNFNMEDGEDIDITYDRNSGAGIYSYGQDKDRVTVNMDYNLKNIKSGGSGLIKYMDDPSDNLSKIWSKASKGYKPYTFEQEEIGKGGQDVMATYQNYDDANKDIKDELTGVGVTNYKDPFENQYDQSNWEFFGFDGEFKNTDTQKEELKNVMTDYMITTFGKRSETRTKEELVTEKNAPTVRSTQAEKKQNRAKRFGARYFDNHGDRKHNYDGSKMAKELNDARHTKSDNRRKVKYFTVRDLKSRYGPSGENYEEVVKWIDNEIGSGSLVYDDVLRVNIGKLDDPNFKTTSSGLDALFDLMNSQDDFENSYSDFGTFN